MPDSQSYALALSPRTLVFFSFVENYISLKGPLAIPVKISSEKTVILPFPPILKKIICEILLALTPRQTITALELFQSSLP